MAVGYQTLKGAVDSPEQPLLHFLVCSNSVIFEVTTVFTDVAFSSVILEVDLFIPEIFTTTAFYCRIIFQCPVLHLDYHGQSSN